MSKNPLAKELMTDRLRTFIIQSLGQGYTPRETTDFALQEFAMEWGLTSDDKAKVLAVRDYIYNRAKDFLYEDKTAQKDIFDYRRQWLDNLESSSRDANKSFRILELSRLKELCIKSGDYRTAVLALKQIAMEKGDLSFGFNLKGKVTHEHRVVRTESEINERLVEILTAHGIDHRVIALIAPPDSKN